ncbi:hypothetical protein MASR1M12_04040 [Erysipelotrichia bacterium]
MTNPAAKSASTGKSNENRKREKKFPGGMKFFCCHKVILLNPYNKNIEVGFRVVRR